jgi:uncharacterized protein (DUF1501 family)
MKRRNFVRNSLLAATGSLWIPNFLKAFEMNNLGKAFQTDKILIIVQFSGGNDGLNTIVPYTNDIYYKERPRLNVPANQILKLSDELGLNPVMPDFKKLFDEGYVSIINNVGYPNPDRSHFRSMDIWHTASDSSEYLSTGWLGRYLDAACQGNCKIAHEVIEIDDTLTLALKGEKIKGLAIKDAKKIYNATQTRQIRELAKLSNETHEHENVSYLYKTLAETVSSAEYLYNKSKTYQSKLTYPTYPFARQLKSIAELINSGLETNVYYTSLGGFDTHVNQKPQQESLLKTYSESMKVFVEDLKNSGRWKDTVIMTFSEFGRRVAQNASAGTDHGKANNVFILGGNLPKAGIFNAMPDLQNLDDGDLKFQVDFRNIYATLLKKQLKVDESSILGKSFAVMDFI